MKVNNNYGQDGKVEVFLEAKTDGKVVAYKPINIVYYQNKAPKFPERLPDILLEVDGAKVKDGTEEAIF